MTLKLGIDFDGVILNNDRTWADYFNDPERMSDHGHPHPHSGDPPTWTYMLDICRACSKVCFEDPYLIRVGEPMIGAVEGIRELAAFSELHLMSHRSPDLTEEGRSWLDKQGILDCFATTQWSWEPKNVTCDRHRCDFLLDDGPANIELLERSGCLTIPVILHHEYNAHVEGFRVHSWSEFSEVMAFAYESAA